MAETPDEIRDRAVKKAMGQEDTEPADDALSRARALPGQVKTKAKELIEDSGVRELPGKVLDKTRDIIRGPKVAPVETAPTLADTLPTRSELELPEGWRVSPEDPTVVVDDTGRRWQDMGVSARILDIDGRKFQALE